MHSLADEIREIPTRAAACLARHRSLRLPARVPYIGMGSSYVAALTALHAGADIETYVASEYVHYLSPQRAKLGVLISQSGETSEVLWAAERLTRAIAITDNPSSSLARLAKVQKMIDIGAGPEEAFSSTKTYINTLVALYQGLGMNPSAGVRALTTHAARHKTEGYAAAASIARRLARPVSGLFVLGSGPNLGSAYEAALTLTETTKRAWTGMSVAQFDHGPKEAADNAVIILLVARGKSEKRMLLLKNLLAKKTRAHIIVFRESKLSEPLSPFGLVPRVYWCMEALARHLKLERSPHLGAKITRTPRTAR